MRYIRTKDGKIFEYAGKERTPYGDLISADGTHYRYDCVLEEADTIEELCDRYVLHQTDIIFFNENHTKYRFENEPDNWYDITDTEIRVGIYGAIWTDKGLIYVAKMNSKGELELL